MLATDELRAWYGPDHVVLAADRGAVGTLLISDELFRYVWFKYSWDNSSQATFCRASDPETRKKYVALVEGIQQKGGDAVIFSSMHESGQRMSSINFNWTIGWWYSPELNQISGIAAILTFPLDVEVVEAEEQEQKKRDIEADDMEEG